MASSGALLRIDAATVRFGGVTAVDGVSLRIADGELIGLLGPNGAGKSTLLSAISGQVALNTGAIHLAGRDLARVNVAARVRLGIGLSHQMVRVFADMTLLQNVALAAGEAFTRTPWRAVMHADRSRFEARALEYLHALGLADLAGRIACTQPYGVLKRLEVARALATVPRVLLLDEPLAGLTHVESSQLADVIAGLHRQGMTVVLIEHKLGEVLRICPRLVVLDNGRKIADGAAEAVIHDPGVVEAYLGAGAAHAHA